jgi:hypothetical protein
MISSGRCSRFGKFCPLIEMLSELSLRVHVEAKLLQRVVEPQLSVSSEMPVALGFMVS